MQSVPLPHARLFIASAALALLAVATVIAATPEDVERARTTGSCSGCDLREANLAGLQAPGGNFSGSNLNGASFYGSDLSGADLTATTLEGTDLKGANLAGATNAVLSTAETDDRTICPNGANGPCQ